MANWSGVIVIVEGATGLPALPQDTVSGSFIPASANALVKVALTGKGVTILTAVLVGTVKK